MAMKHHPSLFYFSAKTGRVSRLFVAFLAICLCAMFIAGCGAKSNAGGPDTGAPQAMPVQVLIAQPQQIASSSEYLAILKSRHSATINPQVEGQVTKTFVKSGDHAKAGDPLLQIDPLKQEATVSSQEATRAAQEANVRFAKISLERAQKLYDAGVIPKQDFDNAQTSYEAAVAQLKSLEHQVQQQNVELHYYRVRAPMDGIVGDIPVRVGDRVTFTTVLTTVDEPGSLEAYIYVPASRAKDLRTGLPVKLMDENGTALADTQVTFVSPQVDSETQTVLAKASIGNRTAGPCSNHLGDSRRTSHPGPCGPANKRGVLCVCRGEGGQSYSGAPEAPKVGRNRRKRLYDIRRPQLRRPYYRLWVAVSSRRRTCNGADSSA
jgi:RND family efflux transporter MFP subunit